MTEYRIAIVNSSSFGKIFPEHLERLKKVGKVTFFTVAQEINGEALAKLLTGYNIIIASVTPFFNRQFFENKDDLVLLSRHGIGYNNVDLLAAREHNTIVSIIPALIERNAVAENNIANLLSLLRRTVAAHTRVKNDHWEDRADFVGNALFNKTVGVIGIGNTGSGVAEILRNGFRCDVLAYDPYKSNLYIQSYGAKKVALHELLKQSDIICLCANLTAENYHMISTKEIQLMKEQVYLSNSARGALVDETAILEGLSSGKLAGYATDVLEEEPGRKNHPYLSFENVVMTPHISAYTRECLEEMGKKCVEDVERICRHTLPDRAVQSVSTHIDKKELFSID